MRQKQRRMQKQEGNVDDEKKMELMRQEGYSNWADGVPEDILDMIYDRLSLSDCLNFSEVCQSWRSCVIEKEKQGNQIQRRGFPWILSSNRCMESKPCFSLFGRGITHTNIPKFIWGSFYDWLYVVDSRRMEEKRLISISLFNPFSRVEIDLPTIKDKYGQIVLSGPPYEHNFGCMLLSKEYEKPGVMSFWKPGVEAWIMLKQPQVTVQCGIYYHQHFYILTTECNLLKVNAAKVWTSGSDAVRYIRMPSGLPVHFERTYLLESDGDLLLVFKCPDIGRHIFHVYRLHESEFTWKRGTCLFYEFTWERVSSLGDRIVLVGNNCSKSYSAKELGVEKANCIYFLNDTISPTQEWNYEASGLFNGSWGIFNLNDGACEVFHFCGNPKISASTWFTMPLWWYLHMN